MMGFAVVAKIEAKYLKAALQQGGCGMQHVTGIGTAFPAMQQHCQVGCRRTGNDAMETLQAHPVAHFELMAGGQGTQTPEPMQAALPAQRSEERREGKECVSTGRYRGSPDERN